MKSVSGGGEVFECFIRDPRQVWVGMMWVLLNI